jgi:excisionase family DNA binding protein
MEKAMSTLEESFAEIVRQVVREELRALVDGNPEALLDAEGAAKLLNVNKQKVYSLVREGKLDAIWISQREMRIAPAAIREFQLKPAIKAA